MIKLYNIIFIAILLLCIYSVSANAEEYSDSTLRKDLRIEAEKNFPPLLYHFISMVDFLGECLVHTPVTLDTEWEVILSIFPLSQ